MSDLICYFSASSAHVTEKAARKIAGITGGSLFEITPAVPYTAADLNWMDKNSRTTLEHARPGVQVPFAGNLPDLQGVDVIYLGFPVWWYDAPRIIYTFLEKLDPEGIALVPFCTSGGTGMDTVEPKLKSAFPNLDWKKGIRLAGSASSEQIRNWIVENQ